MNQQSPLHDQHLKLGAKMVPFGGWDMPVSYPTGTVTEHLATRHEASIFDVSHLGTVTVTGSGALSCLQELLCNDLTKIAPGQTQYTQMLNATGGVQDDIIVWWRAEGQFDVMPNASNTEGVVNAIRAFNNVSAVDSTSTRAVLALQGPQARSLAALVISGAANAARNHVEAFTFEGHQCCVAGTGYTGENGIEVSVPTEIASSMFEQMVNAGLQPAGLGARDTLRLEAGLPLHGNELSPTITPVEAAMNWVVAWDKPSFVGKSALEEQRENGRHRHLVGLVGDSKRPLRDHLNVTIESNVIGVTTSGNVSPMLRKGIAFALLDRPVSPGDSLHVDVRGTPEPVTVVTPPFWKKPNP